MAELGRYPGLPWAILLLAIVFSSGCGSLSANLQERRIAQQFAEDVTTLSSAAVSLHDQLEYLPPETENSCGVSSLDMIFQFEKAGVSKLTRKHLRKTIEEHDALTNGQVLEGLKAAGFLAIHLRGRFVWPNDRGGDAGHQSWQNPAFHIACGRPVILRIQVPNDRFHYVLLVGYDDATRQLVVINPGRGKEVWPASALESWDRADRWFIAYKRPSPVAKPDAKAATM